MKNHGQISLASNYTGIFRNAQPFLHAAWLIPCLWFREFSIFVQKSYTFCHLVHQNSTHFAPSSPMDRGTWFHCVDFSQALMLALKLKSSPFPEEPRVPVEVHYVTFHTPFIEIVPEGEWGMSFLEVAFLVGIFNVSFWYKGIISVEFAYMMRKNGGFTVGSVLVGSSVTIPVGIEDWKEFHSKWICCNCMNW